jgi:hypothetical protein
MASTPTAPNNLFFPANWQSMDTTDADFGANNPIIVDVPGATPSKMVVAIAKDGHFYLLDPARLGGMAGHLVDFSIASANMGIRTVPTAYTSARGVSVALTVATSGVCPNGVSTSAVVLSVLLNPGSPPRPEIAWCAPITGAAAPITTSTDGKSEPVVWYMNGGTLRGVDGDTGQMIYGGTDNCGTIQKWTSPIAVRGHIVVGANGRLCSWSPH